MTDRTGQQLGNYRLMRLLGQGGFGDVYLGEHRHLNTLAALKVLHATIGSENVEQFRREARTIARLFHPHILRVLDFDVQEAVPFLVMDYAPGGTLRQRHPRGIPLSLETVVAYVNQIAGALQYAHEEKVIHRDIKPENLLLGRCHELLLSDFSIALVAESSRSQSTQDVAGTIPYMAPEQLQGRPRPASDQYALGIVVYEWLCGDLPFHGSFTELYGQHLFVLPPPFAEKGQTISPEVEHIVRRALAKEPRDRFESVRAFATALEQARQPSLVSPSLMAPMGVPANETSPATEADSKARVAPSKSSGPAQDQPAQPFPSTELIIPLRQSDLSPEGSMSSERTMPSNTSDSAPPRRRFSRRVLLLAGAGVLLASSGVGLLTVTKFM
jgi:serine/threonine protein kinase